MIPGITAGQMQQAANPPDSLLLDAYPGAVVAFSSSRKLRAIYSGACMRVRRDSDGAEQDIGFAGSALDVAAIASFCAGTTGKVATWYDQSGSNVHVSQTTASAMPIIYESGAVTLINSTPALKLTGSQGLVTTTAVPWPLAGDLTAVVAYRVAGDSTSVLIETGYPNLHWQVAGGFLIDVFENGSSSALVGGSGGNGSTSYGSAPGASLPHNRVLKVVWNPGGATTPEELPTFNINTAPQTLSTFGSPSASTTVNRFSESGIAVGCRGNAESLRLTGSLGEMILYPGTTHAASGLDTDVMTQYGL